MAKEDYSENILKICKVSKKAILPTRATIGSAGMDLHACLDNEVTLKPGQRVFIPCGIAISLPDAGHVALVFARSGLGIKRGITLSNGVGVIDSDYRGEIGVGLYNIGNDPYTIKHGDRIAQLLVMKVQSPILKEVNSLENTARGLGGLGSTGI